MAGSSGDGDDTGSDDGRRAGSTLHVTGLFDDEKPDMEEEEEEEDDESGQQDGARVVGVYLPVGMPVGIRHGGK